MPVQLVMSIEHEDGTGGDLPGWYVRRTLSAPVRSPPGGAVSIAGPFGDKPKAERWLRLRLDDGSLLRMLPIPPATLTRREPQAMQPEPSLPVPAQSPSAAHTQAGSAPKL